MKNLALQYELSITQTIFVKQSPRHECFRLMIAGRHGDKNITQPATGEIIIRNEQQHYTPEFIQLLKDYYLHL